MSVVQHGVPQHRPEGRRVGVGLLGFGTIGSAVARLIDDATATFAARGFSPHVVAALVRSRRDRTPAVPLTTDPDEFFAAKPDVVIEALGGVEPARTLVYRALDAGLSVVTANKSLIAAHGDALADLARRRGVALRFDASVLAGVPFLGTFERRPLIARVRSVQGLLNGTSGYLLESMDAGRSFGDALTEAQRLGFAEPDPSADVSGRDAAEKLAILIRLFAQRRVSPDAIPTRGLDSLTASDLAGARACGGVIKAASAADWDEDGVRGFVGPAFLDNAHPLARVSGTTNGVLMATATGTHAYIGPGAGPDVTAVTLLDDLAEIVTEGRVRPPEPPPAGDPVACARPASAWFARLPRVDDSSAIAELLGSYGLWCSTLVPAAAGTYVLTMCADASTAAQAFDAVRRSTGSEVLALPVLEARC
ncbi:MAG TPA: homoserine dehydrogenase [Vicinamibacterales bacterium]|nr:homoserine dehydrogenase [Vicinamibacterales bacterium]